MDSHSLENLDCLEKRLQGNDENVLNENYTRVLRRNLCENQKISRDQVGQSIFTNLAGERKRSIHPTPFKILDAPYLQDDFYMNVLDWSTNDNLGVSLGNSVYLWSFKTGQVEKLNVYKNFNIPTSLTFDLFSETMAIGTMSGHTEIRDVEKNTIIKTLNGHI